MGPYLKLAVFGLKNVLGGVVAETVQSAVKFVDQHFADNSQTLSRALAKANDRAWKILAIALAGDGWFDNLKNWFAPGDEKAFADQVRLFLKSSSFQFDGSSAQFRKKCLADLNAARQSGLLSARHLSPKDIVEQTASFQRYTDRQGMIEGAAQVVAGIADDLADYPNLAKLLRQATPGGPPLLVATFAYFFRREVETDEELAHGLFFDGLRQLSASQEQAFEEVGKALTTLGQNFEQVFDQLARIEEVVVETQTVAVATHGAVLDIQVEMQRVASMHLTNADEFRRLMQEVLHRVSQAAMQKGEVKPQHSFSIRSEDERNAVKQLLARFRQMPSEQQKQCPALLNGLGKLQIGSGDFDGARQTFLAVSANSTEPTAQAEAQFNAYRAALEEKKWDEALAAIQQAAVLDSQRFAPFPIQRYQPKRILGAGGFGTAFLCHDHNFDEEVVVKTLHDAAMERNMAEVFREARLLRRLSHPAIIGVHECEYADPANHARPYIVMDYFAGGSLESLIQQRGPISAADLLLVACQVAQGMQAAHQLNILHRDLKPDNVLVRKEGDSWKVKVIDFGLAMRKQTIETSMAARSAGNTILGDSVAGTIKYAPPEQMGELKGVKPGPYSDVYSFGKMCCYAMFKTTEPRRRQLAEITEEMAEMLEKCIEQGLEHRFPGFEPVLKVLETLVPSKKAEKSKQQEMKVRQKAGLELKLPEQEEGEKKQQEPGRRMDDGLQLQKKEEDRQKAELKRKRRENERKEKQEKAAAEKELQDVWRRRSQPMQLSLESGRKIENPSDEEIACSLQAEVFAILEGPDSSSYMQAHGGPIEQPRDWALDYQIDEDNHFGAVNIPLTMEAVITAFQKYARGDESWKADFQWERMDLEGAEQQQQQQKDLERLQKDGESKLSQFVRETMDWTKGKPTPEDTAAANEICRQHRLPKERAKQFVDDANELWQKAHPTKPERKPGEIITNSLGMKFVWISPGSFMMGSPEEERGREPKETSHKVTLTKGFYMGVYTVTQVQWKKTMGNNPSHCRGENLPVESVSWNDCQAFIKKLREKDKRLYRLPTEAEWEYACRAGTTTPFHFGETIFTEQANYDGNYSYGTGKKGTFRGNTTPVGSFAANAWGLHDVHGNVWEWCQDWLGDYPENNTVDPQGPQTGQYRVLRGGSWNFYPDVCRSAYRSWNEPGNRYGNFGFRLCFSLE